MSDRSDSFSRTFLRQMFFRIALALVAMGISYGGASLGELTDTEWGPFLGGVAGLGVGIALVAVVLRRVR